MSLKKNDPKGYFDFSGFKIPESLFPYKSKGKKIKNLENEENDFWIGVGMLAVLGLAFAGSVLFYGLHGIKQLIKNIYNFFNF